jgi:hypothetical protein
MLIVAFRNFAIAPKNSWFQADNRCLVIVCSLKIKGFLELKPTTCPNKTYIYMIFPAACFVSRTPSSGRNNSNV